ncbi:MAG: glycosyltransferase, partial [Gammaproteobacteria bacterium]|nr:glycosyltransferase [Gammaproteobacteria bacterium]
MDWSLLALPGFIVWTIILILPWRPWSTRESLDADPSLQLDLSCITVLIPARNEQLVIADTLDALLKQGQGLRIILIDDQSADDTVETARQKEFENLQIINGNNNPDGWTGKLWALEQGRHLVNTDLILLLDADIRLQPGTIAKLLSKLNREQLDMISLMACLRMKYFWEKLLIPAFIFFYKLLYPFQLSNSTSRYVAAAAGGCILIKTSALSEIGGFGSLKECLIDDCALARKIKNNNGKIWIGLTHSAISLRHYEYLQSIWDMVTRTAFT